MADLCAFRRFRLTFLRASIERRNKIRSGSHPMYDCADIRRGAARWREKEITENAFGFPANENVVSSVARVDRQQVVSAEI